METDMVEDVWETVFTVDANVGDDDFTHIGRLQLRANENGKISNISRDV